MTEWGKRESVRSIILVSWFLCFGVIIACKGGNINPSSTVKVSALHWVSVQASMFFLFFSNKNTLLALCFAMKLTLSHCAYDSQRESVSSHSSLSPAVDPWWADIHPLSYITRVEGLGYHPPISLLFLSTPQGRGVCLLPLPMSLRTAKGEGSRSIFFFAFLQQLLFWTHIHTISKASKGISPGTFVIPDDIHGEIWDMVLYLLVPSSSVLWSLGRRICF